MAFRTRLRSHRLPRLLPALALAACASGGSSAPPASEAPVAVAPVEEAPAAPVAATITVPIVALSDFHGHLLPLEPGRYSVYYGGIANLAGTLQHREGITGDNAVLLDNGDMWTGPTESTLLRGESVIQAYNAMGLAAANVANHEFDFGMEILRARVSEARFPFLGANIVEAGTERRPDFLQPFVVVERRGVKVGVIGLSYLHTPKTTQAKHVAGLEFLDYADTLRRVVPEVKAAGAEVVVVLFHDELRVVKEVLEGLEELGIHAVVAGQNHRKETAMVGAIPVVNPGPFGRSYVRFDVVVDKASGEVRSVSHELVDITGQIGAPTHPPVPQLVAIAEGARQKAEALTSQVLGRLAKPLPVGSFDNSALGGFIVDAWLAALPHADLAILNHGAIRQPLASGEVKMGDLLGVMPFENNLYEVSLTGAQITSQLEIDGPVVGGISWTYKEKDGKRTVVKVVDRLGRPLEANRKYRVMILDFMYTGGDGFTFQSLDGAPVDTGLSWREPVMRAFRTAEAASRKVEPVTGARARRVQ